MIRFVALAAICLLTPIAAAEPQTVREQAALELQSLTAELQAHSAQAKAEGAKVQKAFATGDTTGACAKFKSSRVQAGLVLDLLPQQREHVMMLAEDAVSGVTRARRIDEMQGSWTSLASQLDGRIAAVCFG